MIPELPGQPAASRNPPRPPPSDANAAPPSPFLHAGFAALVPDLIQELCRLPDAPAREADR